MQHVYEGLSLCCFVYWGQDRPVIKTDGRTPSQLALEHHEEGQINAYSVLGVQAGQNSKNIGEM